MVWGKHREVVEIKEDADADSPVNQKWFALIRELLAEHDYHFRVWRKSEICAEPRLANAGLLLRYRCAPVPAVEEERIRRAFSSTSELPLRSLPSAAGVTVQSVLRMVLDGTLHVNWWEPFTLNSTISSGPVGPQVWPTPPRHTLLTGAGSFDVAMRV